MDLPCAVRGYGGCAASQQFSFNVPSALAIQFVTVHKFSADCDELPNATRQARWAAGARHERTLAAVACTRLFGPAPAPQCLGKRFLTPLLPSRQQANER